MMQLAPESQSTKLTNPAQARRSSRYLVTLFLALMSATIFEGYDTAIFHLCTPDIARTFEMSDRAIGAMASTVRFGGMLSFFIVILADRFGRKPVISATVLLYTLFTLFTALSKSRIEFTLFQTVSQVFLTAEFGVAVTMIAEEFPDESRGRAVAAMHMVALVGVTVAGLLYGIMVESSWGWRGMYLLGLGPLLVVAILRRNLKETARFDAMAEVRDGGQKYGTARELFAAFTGPYCGRLFLIGVLWSTIGLVGGPMISFFSLYARRDHHWTSRDVGTAIIIAYLMGAIGSFLCGYLMDRWGRRITASAFYLGAAGAMAVLFTADSFATMLCAEIATMFCYQAARTATSALAAELFPTEIRASGFALTVQVLGQVGWGIAPLAIGMLSAPMGGLGNAAALFAAGPLMGVMLIHLFIPETCGRTLEELSPTGSALADEPERSSFSDLRKA